MDKELTERIRHHHKKKHRVEREHWGLWGLFMVGWVALSYLLPIAGYLQLLIWPYGFATWFIAGFIAYWREDSRDA